MELLTHKASLKQEIFRKGKEYFNTLKKVAGQMASDLDCEVCEVDDAVKISYREEGTYEFELQFGGDLLLFNMHTNVFSFDKGHKIYNTGYIKEDGDRGYFCMINIYNFLADSLRYNRKDDGGILLGRIFINREGHYMVEGPKQIGYLFNHLQTQVADAESLKKIIEAVMIYSLEYDLTVPDYRSVMQVSVRQVQAMSDELHLKTTKKVELGYYSRMQKD
jgi:hypothetical protein